MMRRAYRDGQNEYILNSQKTRLRDITELLGKVGLALALLAAAAILGDWRLIPAAVVCGYLFAWIAHAAVERNRPATFTHPWWSLISDFRMFGLWATGKLRSHLDRAAKE